MAGIDRGTTRRKPFRRGSTDRRLLPPSSILDPTSCRVGLGNDVHRLVAGRKLILGGVQIPFGKGPLGHSDGDVLAHAICDALLGAAALGDIGQHFPDDLPQWRNASSLVFLRRVRRLLDDAGYEISNIDAVVGLERPKIAPHRATIRGKLARALGVAPDQVSVKAKSGEGLDAVGRGEAVRADAIALVVRRASGSQRGHLGFQANRRL